MSTGLNSKGHYRPPPSVLRSLSSEILHLIIFPTEGCNFRCVYCYEDFAHGRMDLRIVEGVKKLLEFRAASLRFLRLDWFGGEPLLEQEIIEHVQSCARRLSLEHQDLQVQAGMTTNGFLLLPPVLDKLVALGICDYQITVDGLRSTHDARRFRVRGGSTFDRIWSNLLAARDTELEFEIWLRVNVDRENCAEIPKLLDLMGQEFAGDARFGVFLRSVGRFGGRRDSELLVLDGDEVVRELNKYAEQQGLRLAMSEGPEICYAAAANSFVIRSTGGLAKCTVALRHPNNHVGELHPDGTAELDQEKINHWMRGLVDGDTGAMECPMTGFADLRTDLGGS